MGLIIDQLILHSLEQDHIQVNRLLDLMWLNLKRLDARHYERSAGNIHSILDYIRHKIAGPHGHREKIIFCAIKNVNCPPSLPWGNLKNEQQRIEGIISKAAVLLGDRDNCCDRDWLDAFDTVVTVIRNHIQIEEEIWFPAARLYLTERDWEQVMQTIRASLHEFNATAGERAASSNYSLDYGQILNLARPFEGKPR